jgi:uncharacterized iron-regulated protein
MSLPHTYLTRRRFVKATAAAAIVLPAAGCIKHAAKAVHDPQQIAALPPVSMFAGDNGAAMNWQQLFTAMDTADIVVIGESHTDASGHELQTEILKVAVQRWPGITLSLEEFDRSQQGYLDAFARGELTGAGLKQTRQFVNMKVKANWEEWFLPKLTIARDADAPMLASNAPLKYSRLVRNNGCDNLPELSAAERALFECPSGPVDPAYRDRFAQSFKRAVKGRSGIKQLKDEQIDKLFRAQCVWDATMADSITQARAQGADKVLHLVGAFHCDYNGGLLQELRGRDSKARILFISMSARRGNQLIARDKGKADVVIYTRS